MLELNVDVLGEITNWVAPTPPLSTTASKLTMVQQEKESVIIEPKGQLVQKYHHEKPTSNLGLISAESIEDPDERQRFDDLCQACRSGDVDQVDKLVSYGVNVRNQSILLMVQGLT
jgi:hypothetical protein